MSIKVRIVTEEESTSLRKILAEVKSASLATEDHVLECASLLAHELPRSIRADILEFSERHSTDALLLRLGPAFENEILQTPASYEEQKPLYQFNDFQIAHCIFAAIIGTPIGFNTQREGRCMNNIIPTKDLEKTPNSSSGSMFNFGLHTEDAFHPYKGDYLGLVCIRNEEGARTSFASVRSLKLNSDLMAELFLPQFIIRHNPIHKIDSKKRLVPQSILYGNQSSPFLRINVANTSGIDPHAQGVLEKFVLALNSVREEVVLRSGDFFYLDNLYAAHARDAYLPNYGPKARWLSRLILTKDLRKSATARRSGQSRVIEYAY